MKVTLGQDVQDTLTGFSGIVTGRVEYITGCEQALVQPPVDKDAKFVDAKWFDEDRLKIIKAEPVTLPRANNGSCESAPTK